VRKILIASALFFLIFFYGLVLSQTRVSIIADELEPKNAPGFYDYRGVTNVHTDRNLGSGSAIDVIKAAQESNLDWLFITDLNQYTGGTPKSETISDSGETSAEMTLPTESSREPTAPFITIPDSYHRKTLVLSGDEYSYLDSRLLLFNIAKQPQFETMGQSQLFLADLLSQNATTPRDDLIILAHPLKPGFSWNGPYPSGLDGIEILNLKSAWRKAWDTNKVSFFWSAFVYPFNSDLALMRLYEEPQEELDLWDQLSHSRHTIGMAGAEATAKTGSVGDISWKFPSYQTSFSLLSNHVLLRTELTGEADGDRKKILTGLTKGEFYVSLDVLGNPKGFTAFAQSNDHTYQMGSRFKHAKGSTLVVHLPSEPSVPFEAALIKDGQHIDSRNSVDSKFEIKGPGVYRIIVRVFVGFTLPDGNRWVTWIYTNPFYID
jgi:hypothetical protein